MNNGSHKQPNKLSLWQTVALVVFMLVVGYLQLPQQGGEPMPEDSAFPTPSRTGETVTPQQTTLPEAPVPPAEESPVETAATKEPVSQQPDQSPSTVSVPTDQLDEFDYFVLALSWSPDYCATSGENDTQQCSVGRKLGFVLHGLWPQYNKGYPSSCSTQKMPSSVEAQFPGLYPSNQLYDHEWEKHGTCTGLSPQQYLTLSKDMKDAVKIPAAFRSPEKPFRTSPARLKSDFLDANPGFSADDFEVECSGSGRYLKELYVCFSREGMPIACSAEMHKTGLKSCQSADFVVRNIR